MPKYVINMERTRQALLERQFEILSKLASRQKEWRNRPSRSHSMKPTRPSRPKTAANKKDEEVSGISRIKSANNVISERKQQSESPRRRRLLQRTRINSLPPQKCEVTLVYSGPHTQIEFDRTLFQPPIQDEVLVMQQHCGGENLIVYKGFLKPGDEFKFVSKRHSSYPFALSFYVKGLIDSRLSTCCEYKHRRGVRLGGKCGQFRIKSVQGLRPCSKLPHPATTTTTAAEKSKKKKTKKRKTEPKMVTNKDLIEKQHTKSPLYGILRTLSLDDTKLQTVVVQKQKKGGDNNNQEVQERNVSRNETTFIESNPNAEEETDHRARCTPDNTRTPSPTKIIGEDYSTSFDSETTVHENGKFEHIEPPPLEYEKEEQETSSSTDSLSIVATKPNRRLTSTATTITKSSYSSPTNTKHKKAPIVMRHLKDNRVQETARNDNATSISSASGDDSEKEDEKDADQDVLHRDSNSESMSYSSDEDLLLRGLL
ncbi:unnamed protein product [Didymodactylos carnosus]|uniref:DUF4590 domain-containing protein n=1 Tax=Didymodactylos carnosus TaxID=1234261 RepID=A0A8S2E8N4_9BILA|nr:unnamed protein product [Didymodactylos carnosus]CAF3973422.1 unnamed protein product [Didymodactylos carnosus]